MVLGLYGDDGALHVEHAAGNHYGCLSDGEAKSTKRGFAHV